MTSLYKNAVKSFDFTAFWYARHDFPLRGINFSSCRMIKISTPVGVDIFMVRPTRFERATYRVGVFRRILTDKMLHFQGLYGFRRDSPSFLNDCKTVENTEEIGFLGISDDSSQIVVTVISLPEQHFRKNIKTRCLQNYKQRIFICRSIIKIVSNHILSLLAAARKYTDKIETTSSDSG